MTDVPTQADTYMFEEEGEMAVSLKVAAGRLLKWNKKGRELATPRRKLWIEESDTGECLACKIGLVMIGRYGIKKALDYGGSYGSGRLHDTLEYGPGIACPVRDCSEHFLARRLGWTVEGLFEYHKWSVNRIDKWLAELAEEDND